MRGLIKLCDVPTEPAETQWEKAVNKAHKAIFAPAGEKATPQPHKEPEIRTRFEP